MNNLTFGNATLPVLRDDLLGLAGAGPAFDGTDAVHTHMTNTRLTDPEVLEFRYPVLLEDFHIRTRLGRPRQMERRRRHPPHHPLPREDGLHHPVRPPPRPPVRAGRRRGRPGRRELGAPQRRPDRAAQGRDATVVDAGEAIIIQTPTAGGYGKPKSRRVETRLAGAL